MNLSLTYQPWGETLAELTDAGRRAELAGATVLWTPELHRSAVGVAAALAHGTQTARIGTSILLAFTRSPMITALEALDIDEISGGRFILGLGSGVRRLNEDWHNASFGKPVAHMRETVRNIRCFWQEATSGGTIELPGEYEPMRMRGYQRPYGVLRTDIPIYLAAVGPVMTRLASEVGDGWISHELCSPAYLSERILPELRTSDDRDFDVVASACCSIADDPMVAIRRAAGVVGFYASVKSYADFFAFHGLAEHQQRVIDAFRAGRGADYLAESVSDEMVSALTFSGTREDVMARIGAYEGAASSIKLSPPTHGITADETRDSQNRIIDMIAEFTGGVR